MSRAERKEAGARNGRPMSDDQRMSEVDRTENWLRLLTGRLAATPEDPADHQVARAEEAVRRVHEVLSWVQEKANAPFVEATRFEPQYFTAVTELAVPVPVLCEHLNAVSRTSEPERLYERLRAATTVVVVQLEQVVDLLGAGLRTQPVEAPDDAARQVAEFGEALAGLRIDNEVSRSTSSGPATVDGARAIGDELAAVAVVELRSARRWRCTSITIMVLIAAIAAGILFGTPLAAGSLHGDLTRLSITVPLAAVAAYLGRESSRHRDRGERAHDLGMHLRHLHSFSVPLGEEDGRRYRFELGQRSWPSQDPPPTADPTVGITEELARLTEVLRSRTERPGDPKE